ncbi:hypothetical protein F4679DRAFT_580931 [Xylaria curta]|nr:hypothetical protein F4679DRAFT_580931 [Xylaria curta]
MADPATLALGIAPLVLSAIEGFKNVRSRFRILRSHDRVLRRLRRSFTTQSHIFLDECHLLLLRVADQDAVISMLADDQSELWSDPSLDNKLKEHLGRKFEDVQEIIEEIRAQLKALDEGLNRTLGGATRDVKLTAAEKAREAFDIMSNKAKYETDIDHLKELNQEFKRLRKMANEIKSIQTLTISRHQNQIPEDYKIRGEYARSFYNALRYCWSCAEVNHAEHNMALVLDSANAYDMHIILQFNHKNNPSFKENLLELSVIPQVLPPRETTRIIDRVHSSIIPNTHARPLKRTRLGYKEWSRKPPSPAERAYQATLAESLDKSTDPSFKTTLLMEVNCVEKSPGPIDIRRSHNVCGTLFALKDPTKTMKCYIDTPDNIRHSLAIRSTVDSAVSGSNSRRTATPLLNILKGSLDADLCVTQQLRLVLQLAKGHLQLHWTPWWRQYWSLSDLSYFTEESALDIADLGSCLKTLHISTQLDFETLKFDASTFYLTPEVETALLTHGIRNLSLYCLGIALLQIGRWDPLVDATDDVVVVRRLAARNGRLGPRYQALTQKCIECDFGEGSDLGNPQLQGTIYKSVVCELESLVGVLEKT